MKKIILLIIGVSFLYNVAANASCGSDSTAYVPDAPLWFNMESACEAHDICYDQCGSVRSECDSHFKSDMRIICKDRFNRWDPRRPICLDLAGIYYNAVNRYGEDPYENAQERSCE